MKVIIKCSSDELFGKEFELRDKVSITFKNKKDIITKEMLIKKRETTYFKEKSDLIFELVDYTEIQRND